MKYFTPAFSSFFTSLADNNNTSWFNENRKTYEKEVKVPFNALVEEMIRRIGEYEPEMSLKPADAIMRINKDIRFSKDKTPYNTHVAANISLYGKKDKSYPGFYFQLSPEQIMIVGGAYMEPPVLQEIRASILEKPKKFAAIYSDKAFIEKYGTIQGEKNKRVPEPFLSGLDKEPLLANKQFYYSAEIKPDLLLKEELPDQLMDYYLAGKKLNDFLKLAWNR